MNKLRSHLFFKSVVAVFVITYIFCFSMSMFLIPRCVFIKPAASQSFHMNKSLLRANNTRQNFIMITDRSILDDDQLSSLQSAVVISLLIAVGFLVVGKNTNFI